MAFFNQPGVFTTLLGWEYTLGKDPENDPKGKVLSHRSVLFPGTEGEILGTKSAGQVTTLRGKVASGGGNRRALLAAAG